MSQPPPATPAVHLVLRPSGHIRPRRLDDSEIVQAGDVMTCRDKDPAECMAYPVVLSVGKRAGTFHGLWFYRPM